jgi:nicotinamidase-related amidase
MTYEPLSPTTAALLLVDGQTRVLEGVVKAPPRDEVEANVIRLARAAEQLEMPLIFTTSEEEQNGVLLPAVEKVHPAAYASWFERRGVIDSLADPAVAEALSHRPSTPDHGRDRNRGLRRPAGAARPQRWLRRYLRRRCLRLTDCAGPGRLAAAARA